MIILDSSPVIDIMKKEDGYQTYLNVIRRASRVQMSAVSLYEAGVVLLKQRGPAAVSEMYKFLNEAGVTVVPFDADDARAATDAYQRFGKGIQRPGLNLGDCPVYALAQTKNAAVLSTSDEFIRAGLKAVTPGR